MSLPSHIRGQSALEMLQTHKPQLLGMGCPQLNQLLRGGFTSKGINEIAGEAGCGKTQLCLQLCLQVQLPEEQGGLGGSAVYITSEDVPAKRLHQLASAFKQRHPDIWSTDQSSPMDCIFLEKAETLEEQQHCLSFRIPALIRQTNVKLVVLDSIASLFRVGFESDEYLMRARCIAQHAQLLQDLCTHQNAVVLVTNQVTDVFDNDQVTQSDAHSRGRSVRPALGLSWSHRLFQRIVLTRGSGPSGSENRQMHLKFAPHVPPGSSEFVISVDGVVGLAPSEPLARMH